jgi:DNA-binding transcriptional LysR family regulator
MDITLVGLRVLREVAELGSFTAAAASLGYTQSAISRQVAALESATQARLFDRRPDGVRLTALGRVLLRHAATALDAVDAATRELGDQAPEEGHVRLGAFASAGGWLIPQALAALKRSHPGIEVTTRESGTPALVRSLRAGTLDLALIVLALPFRAPDTETPPLALETLTETALLVAVPAGHDLAANSVVRVQQLEGQQWIASRGSGDELLLGVWPGLAERPQVAHVSRDWLSKLQLVAAGCGITTIPRSLLPVLPDGVRVLAVEGGPNELRRIVLARPPGEPSGPVRELMRALRETANPTGFSTNS